MRKIPNPSDFKAAFCRRTYCNQKQIGGIFIAKLVVAEKPSVAMSYAKVLGATNRQDGYWEGTVMKTLAIISPWRKFQLRKRENCLKCIKG